MPFINNLQISWGLGPGPRRWGDPLVDPPWADTHEWKNSLPATLLASCNKLALLLVRYHLCLYLLVLFQKLTTCSIQRNKNKYCQLSVESVKLQFTGGFTVLFTKPPAEKFPALTGTTPVEQKKSLKPWMGEWSQNRPCRRLPGK